MGNSGNAARAAGSGCRRLSRSVESRSESRGSGAVTQSAPSQRCYSAVRTTSFSFNDFQKRQAPGFGLLIGNGVILEAIASQCGSRARSVGTRVRVVSYTRPSSAEAFYSGAGGHRINGACALHPPPSRRPGREAAAARQSPPPSVQRGPGWHAGSRQGRQVRQLETAAAAGRGRRATARYLPASRPTLPPAARPDPSPGIG